MHGLLGQVLGGEGGDVPAPGRGEAVVQKTVGENRRGRLGIAAYIVGVYIQCSRASGLLKARAGARDDGSAHR